MYLKNKIIPTILAQNKQEFEQKIKKIIVQDIEKIKTCQILSKT